MRDIGKNIKTLRIQKKLTQDELAEQLFITRQTVSNYEIGKSKPDIEMLVKIAEVLNTDIHQLIYGPEPSIEAAKKRRLLIGIAVTAVLGLLYLLLQPVAAEWQSDYMVSMNMLNRAFVLPLVLVSFGWTLSHLAAMALRREPLQQAWVDRARKIIVIILAIALILGIWYFGALVLNDWLFHQKIRGEWVEHEVTNTLDGSTYMSKGWQSLPPPIPDWLGWLGFHVFVMMYRCIWVYPLLGAALWLLGFPKRKAN